MWLHQLQQKLFRLAQSLLSLAKGCDSLARGCDKLARSLFSFTRDYNRITESVASLNRDLLLSFSQRSFGYENLPMLAHTLRACVAHGKKLLKVHLVKLDDQHLGNRPEDLIVTLRYYFLVGGESCP